MINKTVAFTGHRMVRPQYEKWAMKALDSAVERSVEKGFNWFLSGGAPGGDWWFTNNAMIQRYKALGSPVEEGKGMFQHSGFPDGIIVGVALPFASFWKHYKEKRRDDKAFIVQLEDTLDIIITTAQDGYEVWKMHNRNQWLVDNCDVLMSVYDGRAMGGTYHTLKYARKQGKPILWINPVVRKEQWLNIG